MSGIRRVDSTRQDAERLERRQAAESAGRRKSSDAFARRLRSPRPPRSGRTDADEKKTETVEEPETPSLFEALLALGKNSNPRRPLPPPRRNPRSPLQKPSEVRKGIDLDPDDAEQESMRAGKAETAAKNTPRRRTAPATGTDRESSRPPAAAGSALPPGSHVPLGRPLPDEGSIPSRPILAATLQSVVEYAAIVRESGGSVELRLGFRRETLEGLRLRLRALGGRRLALEFRSRSPADMIETAQIAELKRLLDHAGLEVATITTLADA